MPHDRPFLPHNFPWKCRRISHFLPHPIRSPVNTAKMQILKNHVRYTNVNLWISFFFILLMLLSTISFSCYPTICVKMKCMYVCICFLYVFGKYNWGNVVSILFNRILQRRKVWSWLQESKLRSFKMGKNFIKICFAWNRVRISQIWLVLHVKYIIDSKEFLQK